jgi:hypothetical protein
MRRSRPVGCHWTRYLPVRLGDESRIEHDAMSRNTPPMCRPEAQERCVGRARSVRAMIRYDHRLRWRRLCFLRRETAGNAYRWRPDLNQNLRVRAAGGPRRESWYRANGARGSRMPRGESAPGSVPSCCSATCRNSMPVVWGSTWIPHDPPRFRTLAGHLRGAPRPAFAACVGRTLAPGELLSTSITPTRLRTKGKGTAHIRVGSSGRLDPHP